MENRRKDIEAIVPEHAKCALISALTAHTCKGVFVYLHTAHQQKTWADCLVRVTLSRHGTWMNWDGGMGVYWMESMDGCMVALILLCALFKRIFTPFKLFTVQWGELLHLEPRIPLSLPPSLSQLTCFVVKSTDLKLLGPLLPYTKGGVSVSVRCRCEFVACKQNTPVSVWQGHFGAAKYYSEHQKSWGRGSDQWIPTAMPLN